jgi:fumarate reductase subunit C
MTSPATQARLWYAQRISAMVLAVCVAVHLAVIVYATRRGLTGADILARTRGSAGFATFYAIFVVACAVHVPIGLRTVAQEWLRWRNGALDAACAAFALVVLVIGWRAVWAVTVG